MNVIVQAAAIAAISAGGAAVQWRLTPNPDKPLPVACDPVTLSPEEVCLVTVQSEGLDGVVWVDARSKGEWEADSLPGSVHLTVSAGENFDDLLAEAGPQLMGAKRVIIYCGSASCGMSKDVLHRLTTIGWVPDLLHDVKVLHGGHAALKAGGMLKNPSRNF